MTQVPEQNQEDVRLPENAFRELKPGEPYEPVIPGRWPRRKSVCARSSRDLHGLSSFLLPQPTLH